MTNIKKRIVGFLLLFGITLIIIPLFFGRDISSDELKLSGHIPALPAKPTDLSVPIPPKSETVPTPVGMQMSKPAMPTEISPANNSTAAVVTPVQTSAVVATPTGVKPVAPPNVTITPALQNTPSPASKKDGLKPQYSTPIALLVSPSSAPTAAPVLSTTEEDAEDMSVNTAPATSVSLKTASSQSVKKLPAVAHKDPQKTVHAATVTTAKEKSWAVQVGCFAQKSNAENLTKKLKAHGFSVLMQPVQAKSGANKTLVMVGLHLSRPDAKQLETRLQQELNLPGMLVKMS
jgi:cell division septation protein DedD